MAANRYAPVCEKQNRKTNRMKKYYPILLLILFLSCGVYRDKQENFTKINSENVTLLNGNYSVFAERKPNVKYPFQNYANEKFYRKYGREYDTIKFDTISGGSFNISIANDKEINIKFIRDNQVLRKQTLKYKIKDDGFLHIKNRNTIFRGLPFIFGGIDVRKIRIALSENSELLINDVYSGYGAFLFIGDAKSWEETNKYKLIK